MEGRAGWPLHTCGPGGLGSPTDIRSPRRAKVLYIPQKPFKQPIASNNLSVYINILSKLKSNHHGPQGRRSRIAGPPGVRCLGKRSGHC
jgi:hypothetical protein